MAEGAPSKVYGECSVVPGKEWPAAKIARAFDLAVAGDPDAAFALAKEAADEYYPPEEGKTDG